MTREEIKTENSWWIGRDEVELIDQIYDDFESRTCENCKWFSGHKIGQCYNKLSLMAGYTTLGKFGCNHFEGKYND